MSRGRRRKYAKMTYHYDDYASVYVHMKTTHCTISEGESII